EPPAEPFARPVPAPYRDDPYVVTRYAAIAAAAAAAIATSSIDDDDDTAPMDLHPYEPQHKRKPTSSVDTGYLNRMIQESVEAAIRAERERERVQNEAKHSGGPNVALVAQECTFADFMKCSPITFHGNEGAVVFAAATFQDRALTWWNSQAATLGIEAMTRKT
nr:hypothetical protein [Tanacetum cinerariifolium]